MNKTVTNIKKSQDAKKGDQQKKLKNRIPIPSHLATEETKIEWSVPVDFTFKGLRKFEKLEPETANTDRLGRVDRGGYESKYLSKSLWINNNSLQDTKNIDETINSLMHYPEKLSFLNLSFNELKEINDDLLKFPNLNILYLHGNKLTDINDVVKLRKLKKLHILTLYGNPFYDDKRLGNIRAVISYLLPQVIKLDYNGVSKKERVVPVNKRIRDLIVIEETTTKGFQPVIIDETKIRRNDLNVKKTNNAKDKNENKDKQHLKRKNNKPVEKKEDSSNKPNEQKMYEPILVSKCVCE